MAKKLAVLKTHDEYFYNNYNRGNFLTLSKRITQEKNLFTLNAAELEEYTKAVENKDLNLQKSILENMSFLIKWPSVRMYVLNSDLKSYLDCQKNQKADEKEDIYNPTSEYWYSKINEEMTFSDGSPLLIAAYYEDIDAIKLVLNRFQEDEQKQLIERALNSLANPGKRSSPDTLFTLISVISDNSKFANLISDYMKKHLEVFLIQKLETIHNLDEVINFCEVIMKSSIIKAHTYYNRYPYNKITLFYYMQKKVYQLITTISDPDAKKLAYEKIIETGLFDESHLENGVIGTFYDLFTSYFAESSLMPQKLHPNIYSEDHKIQKLIANCHKEDILKYYNAVRNREYENQDKLLESIGILKQWPDLYIADHNKIPQFTTLYMAAFMQDNRAINIILDKYKNSDDFALLVKETCKCNTNFYLETMTFLYNALSQACDAEQFAPLKKYFYLEEIEKSIENKIIINKNIKNIDDLLSAYTKYVKNGIVNNIDKPSKNYFFSSPTYSTNRIIIMKSFQNMALQFLYKTKNFEEKAKVVEQINESGIFAEEHFKFGVPEDYLPTFTRYKNQFRLTASAENEDESNVKINANNI